jgi:hypothetical protein
VSFAAREALRAMNSFRSCAQDNAAPGEGKRGREMLRWKGVILRVPEPPAGCARRERPKALQLFFTEVP